MILWLSLKHQISIMIKLVEFQVNQAGQLHYYRNSWPDPSSESRIKLAL